MPRVYGLARIVFSSLHLALLFGLQDVILFSYPTSAFGVASACDGRFLFLNMCFNPGQYLGLVYFLNRVFLCGYEFDNSALVRCIFLSVVRWL